MSRLTLHRAFLNPDNKCEVFAFIYHGSQNRLTDQNNRPISELATIKRRVLFEQHMMKEIMPLLQSALQSTNYMVKEVGSHQHSSQPFLVIAKKNGRRMNRPDLGKICHVLHHAISEHNKPYKIPLKKRGSLSASRSVTFAADQQGPLKKRKVIADQQEELPRYNLRSRQ